MTTLLQTFKDCSNSMNADCLLLLIYDRQAIHLKLSLQISFTHKILISVWNKVGWLRGAYFVSESD